MPYWFATPVYVFIETHYSDSFNPSDKRLKWTLDEFEMYADNQLEYHILGLTCLDSYKPIVKAFIKTSSNPLVIEYTSKNPIVFTTSLVEEKSGDKLDGYALIQSELDSGENKYRYCLLVDIPEIGKNYTLRLFGLKKSEKDETHIYPMLTEYLISRTSDQFSYIPQYNIIFLNHGIKLISHHRQIIYFKVNPLVMRFYIPESEKVMFKLTTQNDKEIHHSVLGQKNYRNMTNEIVDVAVPSHNQTYFLKLYARNSTANMNTYYDLVNLFHLVRFKTNENDKMQLAKQYTAGENSFIYSPMDFYLQKSKMYEFMYVIKNASDVVLVDSNKKWTHLEKSKANANIWWATVTSLDASGQLNVFAKFLDGHKSYIGMFYYEVK